MASRKSVSPIEKAIRAANGQTELARLLSAHLGRPVRQGNVWSWLNRTKRVPAEFALPIEIVTGGKVTRHELRPDLYPIERRA
jgi:DNA-binding transcriptional regulator YdaS (Cro superfamily)